MATMSADGVPPFVESELVGWLQELEQQHIIEAWPENAEKSDKERLWKQLHTLNGAYPGGLKNYILQAKKLLLASQNNENPFDGYLPEVPTGEHLDYTTKEFEEYEVEGIQQFKNAVLCLVAGGLGERLGYSGIKLGLPTDLCSMMTYLEWYCQWILAIQARLNMEGSFIPFAIMTSDDTHDRTYQLLKQNNWFGTAEGQVVLVKQEMVPAVGDNDGHFVALKDDPFQVQAKPYGHGRVHGLLLRAGLVDKWKAQNKQWIIFIQDTNGNQFRIIPAALAVSHRNKFAMNSLSVPRKPKEAIGGIVRLVSQVPEKVTMTCNVEYNQLDGLLSAAAQAKGETYNGETANPEDPTGHSIYPGNVNILIMDFPVYYTTLRRTGGMMPDFINPKYTDATKTAFKAPARLESMMQDFGQLLAQTKENVGFTCVERKLGYSPSKNSIADGRTKDPPSTAATAEHDMYWANARTLELAGANIEWPKDKTIVWAGVPCSTAPKIVIHPSFGVTRAEIRQRIHGHFRVTARSMLSLRGDIHIYDFDVDGTVIVRCTGGGTIKINRLHVRNPGWQFEPVDINDTTVSEELRIRGYRLDFGCVPPMMAYDRSGVFCITEYVDNLRIAFIGSGPVALGAGLGVSDDAAGDAVGLDYASRLEFMPEVSIAAIVDPNHARAAAALTARQSGSGVAEKWRGVPIFSDVKSMLESLPRDQRPNAALIALPPTDHGSTGSGKDVEVVAAMGGMSFFVVPPLSAMEAGDNEKAGQTGPLLSQLGALIESQKSEGPEPGEMRHRLVCGWGYNLRYSEFIEEVHEILIHTRARVWTAIVKINEPPPARIKDWESSSGAFLDITGHLLDFLRHLVGEVEATSIQANALAVTTQGETTPDKRRAAAERYTPQSTHVNWRFNTGGVGTLIHSYAAKGATAATTSIELWADTVCVTILEPLGSRVVVKLRYANGREEERVYEQESIKCGEKPTQQMLRRDNVYKMLRMWVHGVKMQSDQRVRSTYADAFETHKLCTLIRAAAQRAAVAGVDHAPSVNEGTTAAASTTSTSAPATPDAT